MSKEARQAAMAAFTPLPAAWAEFATVAGEGDTEAARFGRRLLRARKAAGLSQEGLGAILGVHQVAVSQWESGRALPSLENWVAIVRWDGGDFESWLPSAAEFAAMPKRGRPVGG